MEHSMSIFLKSIFTLPPGGWHEDCSTKVGTLPATPPRGGGGGDPIIGQVFFIVKRKNRVVFNEGNKT
jgi:hypothetical protein